MSGHTEKISILFCCLGNICRSPMAQAVFQHLIAERHLESHFDRIESAGTGGYHVGDEPDDRTIAICKKKGVSITSLAQVVEPHHFTEFDYIIGMDAQNISNLKRMAPKGSTAEIKLFGEYGDGRGINDPYYQKGGFESTYEQVLAYSEGLLDSLGFGKK